MDRLNEIKKNWDNAEWGIDKDDIEWLIGYAEESLKIELELRNTIERLQKENQDLIHDNIKYMNYIKNKDVTFGHVNKKSPE